MADFTEIVRGHPKRSSPPSPADTIPSPPRRTSWSRADGFGAYAERGGIGGPNGRRRSGAEDVVQLALRRLAELLRDLLTFALAIGDLAEKLAQLRGHLAGVQSHHAQGRLVVEDDRQDRALADEGQLDVVLLALVEHDGEFLFAQQLRHLLGGGEGAGDEGGDGIHVVGGGLAFLGDQVAVLVDEE